MNRVIANNPSRAKVDEDGYLIVDPEAREARIAELIDRGIDLE